MDDKDLHILYITDTIPDSKVYGAYMGPTWVLSAPDGPHVPCLRDWSRSGGSYGNNTRVICCPAPGRPESAARGTSPPDNKSRGCCCRNSRPTVINPDYNMTKQRYITRIYDKKTFKITTKSSDVAYLPPLWRHASLLNDGSCSFTHPVAKGRSARGTSPGT